MTDVKRSILIALLAVASASPSFADVTVKSNVAGKGMGMGGTMATTTFIKGTKMRTDTVMGDTTVTSVETATLAADLFAVPAGYKIKEQK